MQNILVIGPAVSQGCAAFISRSIRGAGYWPEMLSIDANRSSGVPQMLATFGGRLPDLIIVDMSTAPNCLPLRHTRSMLHQSWGEDIPLPPCLAIMALQHLTLPDWLAFADDFLLAPPQQSELLARIRLLLFRHKQIHSHQNLKIADVVIDLSANIASADSGKSLPLTPREFELLRFFAVHRGKFFARNSLLDLVWGIDYDGGERTVDIHVRRLRSKLPPIAAHLIETRRGIGYGLRATAD